MVTAYRKKLFLTSKSGGLTSMLFVIYTGFVVKTARLALIASIPVALLLFALLFVTRARADEPRTQTTFTQTGEGAEVIPYLRRGGKEVLFVDIEDYKDFDNVSLNFTYMSGGTKRGVVSNVNPQPRKADGSFGGKEYIRGQILHSVTG